MDMHFHNESHKISHRNQKFHFLDIQIETRLRADSKERKNLKFPRKIFHFAIFCSIKCSKHVNALKIASMYIIHYFFVCALFSPLQIFTMHDAILDDMQFLPCTFEWIEEKRGWGLKNVEMGKTNAKCTLCCSRGIAAQKCNSFMFFQHSHTVMHKNGFKSHF